MSPSDLTDEAVDRDPPSAADRWLEGMPRNHDKVGCVMPPDETAGWGTCVSWGGIIVARVPGRKLEAIARTAAMIAAAPRLIRALREKVIALQAIVEGRTAAPTDEEIDAHCSRYGAWVIGHRDGGGMMIAHDAGLAREIARRHRAHPGMGWTWHALDATGRPCAWPVVTPADGTAHEVVILCHGCGAPAGGTRPVPSTTYHTPSCRACASGMTFEPFAGGARG